MIVLTSAEKNGLACLDDLAKRHRARVERQDGRRVRSRRAEGDREHGDEVAERHLGETLLGGRDEAAARQEIEADDPDQQRVGRANTQLQRCDRHPEATMLAAGRIKCLLVLDVVEGIAEVPEGEVETEREIATVTHGCV